MLDLSWLTPELAIGGAISPISAGRLAREHAITGVIDVRAENCDDVHSFRAHGISLLSLPTIDHAAIGPDMLADGVAFAVSRIARARRVLIHCQHGIGRSALLALCVLVELGWEPVAALALAKQRRAQLSPSPAQYEAWAAWLRGRGSVAPEFEVFAAIAYRGVEH